MRAQMLLLLAFGMAMPPVQAGEAWCASHHCAAMLEGTTTCCKYCSSKPYLIFAHQEKTGGSSIECAARDAHLLNKRWLNMGHARSKHIEHCRRKCSKPSSLIIGVRDPLEYFLSEYSYALHGVNSGSANYMKKEHIDLSRMSFEAFVEWVYGNHIGFTQTSRLNRTCGIPCRYDYVIHTESIQEDLDHILGSFFANETLPNMTIGHKNVTPLKYKKKTAMTERARELIYEMEYPVFAQFGYDFQAEIVDDDAGPGGNGTMPSNLSKSQLPPSTTAHQAVSVAFLPREGLLGG